MDILSFFRKLHRITSSIAVTILLFISVTGLLLGWKKNSGEWIQAKSYSGTSTDLKDWLSIDSLHKIACKIMHDSISPDLSLVLDRIDIRKDKGMVKFIFTDRYLGIQLDGATGKLLKIEKRRSDLIENIHDGSILDRVLGIKNGTVKLIYTTAGGVSLLIFTVTGFWLWYAPKMKKRKKRLADENGDSK